MSDCASLTTPNLGNSALVTYGGTSVGGADGIKVPFVSKDVEYVRGFKGGDVGSSFQSDRWIEKEIWTLDGELLDCKGYDDLLKHQNTLYDIFYQDYLDLQVGALDTLKYARVVSINFEDSNYVTTVPYTVVLEGYRNIDDMAAANCVVSPSAAYTWAEGDDGTMTLTYNISAQGINTNSTASNALANAQAFVEKYLLARGGGGESGEPTGESPEFFPSLAYHDLNPEGKRYLVSDEANIDRVTQTYGITRVYKIDQTAGQLSGGSEDAPNSVLRYTTEVNQPYGENTVTTFRGSIEIGYYPLDGGNNIEILRQRYYNFKQQGLIKPEATQVGDAVQSGDVFLPENITQETVEEDALAGVLTFTIVFSDEEEGCKDDFGVGVSESAESSLITVNLNGSVSHKGACGWNQVAECFYGSAGVSGKAGMESQDTKDKLYDRAYSGYHDFIANNGEFAGNGYGETIELNRNPLDYSITEDPINNTISYSVRYDDRLSFGAHKVDYTMNITPPVEQVSVNSFSEICGVDEDCADRARSHHYFDLGIGTRGKFGVKIQVEGTADQFDGADTAFTFAENLLAKNISPGGEAFLTRSSKGKTENPKQTNLDVEWLWKSEDVVNSDSSNRRDVKKLYFGEGEG